MENIIVATHAVLPTLLILCVGYATKILKVLTYDKVKGLNKSITYVFLPCLTSSVILKLDVEAMKDFELLTFCILAIVIILILGIVFKKYIDKNEKRATAILNTIIDSNSVILAGSIAMSLYGVLPPLIGFITSVSATVMNACAIFNLEMQKNKKLSFKTIISVLKNPLVCTVVVSVIIKALSINLPNVIVETIDTLGKATMPLSLITLGIFFTFDNFGNTIGTAIKALIIKYVIGIVVLLIAIFIGFRGQRLATVLFLFLSSSAIATYPLAIDYDMDSEITGNILIVSTIMAILVFSVSIYVLSSFNMI